MCATSLYRLSDAYSVYQMATVDSVRILLIFFYKFKFILKRNNKNLFIYLSKCSRSARSTCQRAPQTTLDSFGTIVALAPFHRLE